jgi:hypothetical protein
VLSAERGQALCHYSQRWRGGCARHAVSLFSEQLVFILAPGDALLLSAFAVQRTRTTSLSLRRQEFTAPQQGLPQRDARFRGMEQ